MSTTNNALLRVAVFIEEELEPAASTVSMTGYSYHSIPDSRDEEQGFEPLSKAAPENGELHDYYMLIQTLLLNSVVEMHRPVGMKREPGFWRSRYADFFIDMLNTMRTTMRMPPISSTALRRGISRKFNMPIDWLMPNDGLTDDEVAAECARYALMWERIAKCHPEGIEDESSHYLFTPNREPDNTPESPMKSVPGRVSLLRNQGNEAPRVTPRPLAQSPTAKHASWMLSGDDEHTNNSANLL